MRRRIERLHVQVAPAQRLQRRRHLFDHLLDSHRIQPGQRFGGQHQPHGESRTEHLHVLQHCPFGDRRAQATRPFLGGGASQERGDQRFGRDTYASEHIGPGPLDADGPLLAQEADRADPSPRGLPLPW